MSSKTAEEIAKNILRCVGFIEYDHGWDTIEALAKAHLQALESLRLADALVIQAKQYGYSHLIPGLEPYRKSREEG